MNLKNLMMWGVIVLLVVGLFNLFQNPKTERQGFNLIVRSFQERIYWHVRKIVIDHDDTDDVMVYAPASHDTGISTDHRS